MKTATALLIAFFLFAPRSKAVTGLAGMAKSSFLPPYNPDGSTTFINTRHKSGVYFIKNSVGEIVYVGYSKNNLYRTLYRHFQKWDDSQQPRVVYKKTGYTVRVILCTPNQATRLEKYLVNKMKPRDNSITYDDLPEETGANDYEKSKDAEVYEPAPF